MTTGPSPKDDKARRREDRRRKFNTPLVAWADYEMIAEVEAMARRMNVSRSECIRTFIEWGIQAMADDIAQGGRGGR